MRICVLGTGYVGLVAGACLSDTGNHVVCVDVNEQKIAQLKKGILPIYEPGLEDLVARNVRADRLSFSTDTGAAVGQANAIFIAVGTPQDEDGSSDLRYVIEAVKQIRQYLTQDALVIMKSTVPVGTADRVRAELKGTPFQVDVVSNPEFLKEGTAIDDFLKPERVIIGCDGETPRRKMTDLYSPFTRSGNPILFMSNRSAELAKYAANAFLAMKISYINDMAQLSEIVGADVRDVRKAIVTDSRIGNKFLYPGCGYGGSCFPKDVQALIHLGKENDFPLGIFEAVHKVNERQKGILFEKIERHFQDRLKGKTFALWGLSFKPLTDDMREAPSVRLVESLLKAQCRVLAYDPVANHEAKRLFGDKIEICDSPYQTLTGADALAICTEWNEFRSPDFPRIRKTLSEAVVFDGRNLYDPHSMKQEGFTYYSIGTAEPK